MLIFIFIAITGLILMSFDVVWLIMTGIAILILMIIQYVYRYEQIADEQKIYETQNKKIIYEQMVDDQLTEFKKYLGDMYPTIEKAIFDSISPKDLDLYFVKYPEIKSDKTITDLVKLINKKTSNVYECDLRITELLARMNTRYLDSKAWCIPGIVKKPKTIKEDIKCQ